MFKSKHLTYLLNGLLIITIAFSCVSKKKYNALNAKKSGLEYDKAECQDQLKIVKSENIRLSEELETLKAAHSTLIEDTTKLGTNYRKAINNYKDLDNIYEKLLKDHDRLLSHNSKEIEKLSKDLSKREKEVIVLQNDLQERERRVKELEKILADKEKAVKELKDKVMNALIGFKDKDLTIEVKNGKVYVSLAEQLLFKSGSTEVDGKGAEALKKLGEALKDQSDLSIMVEGHTDDVPMAKGTTGMKDNWDLSVLRATSITRILINAGINPKSLTPSGKGEYSPIATGKTSEARQKNRRTEIILTPKLDELFKILENN